MSTHSENPFAPPAADLATNVEPEPGSPSKAVLLGFAVDFLGSNVVGLLVGIAYGVSLVLSGMTREQLADAASHIQPGSWPWITSIVIGCAFSILGGYVCARIAKRLEYRLGAVLAVLDSLAGILLGADKGSLAMHAALVAIGFMCVLTGAALGVAKNRAWRYA